MCIDAMTPILDLIVMLCLQSGLVALPICIVHLSHKHLSLRRGYITRRFQVRNKLKDKDL